MTIIIKKGESPKSIQKKLKEVSAKQSIKQIDVRAYTGMLKNKFKGDAVEVQKKMRDEWD